MLPVVGKPINNIHLAIVGHGRAPSSSAEKFNPSPFTSA
jgi:hypothetical protein